MKSVFQNPVQKDQHYEFYLPIYSLKPHERRTRLYDKCPPSQEVEGIQVINYDVLKKETFTDIKHLRQCHPLSSTEPRRPKTLIG